MNKTVWKYSLDFAHISVRGIPEHANPLFVAVQEGVLCVWFCVVPELPKLTRKFFVSGTGMPVSADVKYIGSCIDEAFVWHVWEICE